MTPELAQKIVDAGIAERLLPLYEVLRQAYSDYSGNDIAEVIGLIRAEITLANPDINK